MKSLVELNSNKKWFNTNGNHYWLADINNIDIIDSGEIVYFDMQKSKLIELRDSIL